jgi:4-amino-4-deoxy-L-arabinose transferase-like glycosyltransferase
MTTSLERPTDQVFPAADRFSPRQPVASGENLAEGPRVLRVSVGAWLYRLGFGALLAATGALYLTGLSKSGWANQFYAAAGQAGMKSWTAFLFGSLDQSNFITVDKPPASLWVISLSMRLFGVNSWSLLLPQALAGVASVAFLVAAVRRVAGQYAGLFAGAALATTPVAALMFRYDNPDALLTLLLTAAAYAVVRAIEAGRTSWLVLAGTLVGFGFLTKMLQAFLVLPAFAVAYLIAAPVSVRRRIAGLAAGLGAVVVSAGWWIALVELWPAGSRPYIGGSNSNNILELIFGYNGFGRLDGSSNNGAVNGGTGGFSTGSTGLTRLFGLDMGTQISWLLPSALVALGGVLWLTGRRPRTDRLRVSLIIWGGWLIVTGVVFSFASGIIHPYYTVALAPAIAALAGIGVTVLWRRAWLLATIVGATAMWSFTLLGRSDWHPELRWIVLFTGGAAVVLILTGIWTVLTAAMLSVALLLGPAAYALQTAATAHTGAIPSAGPATTVGFGGGRGGAGGQFGAGQFAARGGFGGTTGGFGGVPLGPGSQNGSSQNGGGTGRGMPGGLSGATTVSSDLVAALRSNAESYEWVAATTGDNEAASLELATDDAVMSLGGYNGTDPAITLAQFRALVAAGKIHYYVLDQGGFIGSTTAQTSTAYAIQQWVTSTFTAQTIGGSTVYDLTS